MSISRMTKLHLFLAIVALLSVGSVHAGLYDASGLIPESGAENVLPEENINLFNGNLTLVYKDIHLPGPNGFDVNVWRVYNSKIRKEAYNTCQMSDDNGYYYLGRGWSMHMGYLTFQDELLWTSNVNIQFPDGKSETAYLSLDGTHHLTKSYLKYDRNTHKLYFPDGTVWVFGAEKSLNLFPDVDSRGRVVTSIENPYGQQITIEYWGPDTPFLKTITDSLGRTIHFDLVTRLEPYGTDMITIYELDKIRVLDESGNEVVYTYDVSGMNPDGTGENLLMGFYPPEIPPTTYEYNDHWDIPNGIAKYHLKAINTSFGGRVEYTFEERSFHYTSGFMYCTFTVKTRTIWFDSYPGGDPQTWTYYYPSYIGTDDRTTKVAGPELDTYAKHHTVDEAGWAGGLLEEKYITESGSAQKVVSEVTSWQGYQITNVPTTYPGGAQVTTYAPLVSAKYVTTEGDADTEVEYWYGESSTGGTRDLYPYGLPCLVMHRVSGSDALAERFEYVFENDQSFLDRYMLSYKSNQEMYSIDPRGPIWYYEEKTLTDYWSNSAVKQVNRWVNLHPDDPNAVWLTTDYSYTENGTTFPASDIEVTEDLPGAGGVVTRRFLWGTLAEVQHDTYGASGFVELSRTVSEHNSAILSETNQHGGTMTYVYDDLGRITDMLMPSAFNDIHASWQTNSLTITQGAGDPQVVTRYWDGMGRSTGHIVSGDSTTLYYNRALDAEGRVVRESKGSPVLDASYDYVYTYDAAGRVLTTTDPSTNVTTVSYSGDRKTITDGELNQTMMDYWTFPGLVTQLTDAGGNVAEYYYDAFGRVMDVTINGPTGRKHEFRYDYTGKLIRESHPETGNIYYEYNSEGLLERKLWDGTLEYYEYNTANQIRETRLGYSGSDPEQFIYYDYYANGTLAGVSSSQGWSRDGFTYNELGALLTASHTIPGLGSLPFSYTYDANSLPESVTYPSGRTVQVVNNGLALPETVSFNGSSLVTSADYGYAMQPTSLSFANGTTLTATYDLSSLLDLITVTDAQATTLYQAQYLYNGVGNIDAITSTVPALDADFDYDNLHRLVMGNYTGAGGKRFDYQYDAYGNMEVAQEDFTTVASFTHNPKNQISDSGYAYDNRGNMTSDPTNDYAWSSRNYLDRVVRPINQAPMLENVYDDRGLRMKATRRLPFAPDGGELWKVGEIRDIEWVPSAASGGTVKIEYSTDGGTSWRSVDLAKTSTDDDGLYEWTIPNLTGPSAASLVRVTTLTDEVLYQSYSDFSIDAPVVTVQSPAGGESWEVGTTQDLTWTSSAEVGNVEIDYSVDGVSWLPITAGTENDGSYSWLIPNTPATGCQVRVREIDDYPEGISAPFDILEEPVITVTLPFPGAVLYATSTCTLCNRISWTSEGSVGNVKIEYSTDSGNQWNLIVASTENDGVFDDWVPPNTPSSNCLVRISDVDGYPTGVTPSEFEIKEPELVVTFPVGGETFYVGQHQFVTWDITTQDYVPPVDITVIKDGEKYCAYTIRPTHVTDEVVSFFISSCVGTDLKIRIATSAALYESAGTFDIVWPYLADFTDIDGGEATLETNDSYMAEWGDYDADNDLDLVVVEDGATNIYRNDCSPTCTLTKVFTVSNSYTSASWGDYDNDGLLDLYLTRARTNSLYHSIGSDQFESISKIPPVKDRADSMHSQWVDYDNDGNLDLFVANSDNENFLYHNLGGGSFDKISNQELVDEDTSSFYSSWADYDNDGDLDVFIANDGTNRLYRNLYTEGSSGEFSRITVGDIEIESLNSNSAAWGDFDHDGDLDIVITNKLSDHSLLINDGNHQFRRYSDVDASGKPLSNMLRTFVTGSPDFACFFSSADFDNDGDDDVLRTINDPAQAFSNTLFKNVGDPNFILSSTFYDPAPFRDSPGFTSHAAWGDFDNDGDLDLFLTQVGGRNWLYQNNLIPGKSSVVGRNDLSNGSAIVKDDRDEQTGAAGSHSHRQSHSDRDSAAINNSQHAPSQPSLASHEFGNPLGRRLSSLIGPRALPMMPHNEWSMSHEWSGGSPEPQLAGRGRAWGSLDSIGTSGTQRNVVSTVGAQARTALRVPEASWIDHRSSDRSQEHSRQENGSQVERKEAVPKSGVIGNVDTYYIYANDEKLMAEYDADGACTSEYIYLGDVLVAEYHPQKDTTYYYLNDQIRSTHLITEGSGAVVYSASYGPFGEELTTWVDTYDPKPKFSGKEREEYSGQDYFGARYYDHKTYRFTSVDPVINKDEAIGKPQLRNLYSYSINNPINYFDPDGALETDATKVTKNIRKSPKEGLMATHHPGYRFNFKLSLSNDPKKKFSVTYSWFMDSEIEIYLDETGSDYDETFNHENDHWRIHRENYRTTAAILKKHEEKRFSRIFEADDYANKVFEEVIDRAIATHLLSVAKVDGLNAFLKEFGEIMGDYKNCRDLYKARMLKPRANH